MIHCTELEGDEKMSFFLRFNPDSKLTKHQRVVLSVLWYSGRVLGEVERVLEHVSDRTGVDIDRSWLLWTRTAFQSAMRHSASEFTRSVNQEIAYTVRGDVLHKYLSEQMANHQRLVDFYRGTLARRECWQ